MKLGLVDESALVGTLLIRKVENMQPLPGCVARDQPESPLSLSQT